MSRRVVVTGIGIVSPIGTGRAAFWQNLCAGRSGVRPITRFPFVEGGPRLAAEVDGFEPRELIRSKHLRRMDWFSRMIVGAARAALHDAGIDPTVVPPEEIGVVVGTQLGDVSESFQHLERFFTRGATAVSPMTFPNLVLNAAASYVSMELGATGTNLTLSQGEVSGEAAVREGFDLIRRGQARIVIAGGGDELAAVVAHVYRLAGALSGSRGGTEWSSPYDAARNGVVLGEGAAMLVLESLDQACAAGRRAYAEIAAAEGFSVPAARYDLPRDAGACSARLPPGFGSGGQIDLVIGSANSSQRADALEIAVYDELAAGSEPAPWLTSIKGAVGEFGAAGALSVAAGCLALHEQTVPPLCHLQDPATRALRLAVEPQAAPLRRVLCAGFARGGAAATVLLERVCYP